VQFRVLAIAFSVGAAACTGASVPAYVEDEPICADFSLGAAGTKMKGGLRKPVKVQVMNGDSVESERILLGRRTAEDEKARVVVEDDDERYTIRWSQCENERAPRRVGEGKPDPRDAVGGYSCGEAKVYQEVPLEVREGDPASRTIRFVAPPAPECWTDALPSAAPSPSAASSAK
jgi:hypothetical protein